MNADRTGHVLAAIDGALEDWSVSGDAMRWAPEPPARRSSPGTLVLHTAMPEHPWHVLADRHGQVLVVDWAALERGWQATARSLGAAVEQACEGLRRLGGARAEAGHHPVRPPSDPRARALWLRQRRGTGPARPGAGQARRPRRHGGWP